METVSTLNDDVKKFKEFLNQISNESSTMAILRRTIGHRLDGSPRSWPYVFKAANYKRMSEPVAYLALGLFALHHQSKDPGSMNKDGVSLGSACKNLKQARHNVNLSEDGVERRFRSLLASEDIDSLAIHLRALITLMRSHDISIDYAQLYKEIYIWLIPQSRAKVCLGWARDYYRASSQNVSEYSKGENKNVR
jgi:CRISPR system Cascade subunit CasB